MSYYDPNDIISFNNLPAVHTYRPNSTIYDTGLGDATIGPNTPGFHYKNAPGPMTALSNQAVQTGLQAMMSKVGQSKVGQLSSKHPVGRYAALQLGSMIAAPLAQQAIGGSAGEHVGGLIGGAGTGAGLGMMFGPEGALIGAGAGALLGGSGLGKKIPLVGPLLFGGLGGGAPEEVTQDDFTSYGAPPEDIHRIMGTAQKIEHVENKAAAQAYLANALSAYRAKLIAGPEALALGTPAERALIAQASSRAMLPYRDEALKNIDIARQAAIQQGLSPAVANQYSAMSKNVANAYAQQAISFGSTNAMQQTLQDQLNAQQAAGSGSTSGLFDQLGTSA